MYIMSVCTVLFRLLSACVAPASFLVNMPGIDEIAAVHDQIAATRSALHLALNQVAQLSNRVEELEQALGLVPQVVNPTNAKYYVVYEPAPGQEAGVYRSKASFARAIEAVPGTPVTREGITVHAQASAHATGFQKVADADTNYTTKTGLPSIHRW